MRASQRRLVWGLRAGWRRPRSWAARPPVRPCLAVSGSFPMALSPLAPRICRLSPSFVRFSRLPGEGLRLAPWVHATGGRQQTCVCDSVCMCVTACGCVPGSAAASRPHREGTARPAAEPCGEGHTRSRPVIPRPVLRVTSPSRPPLTHSPRSQPRLAGSHPPPGSPLPPSPHPRGSEPEVAAPPGGLPGLLRLLPPGPTHARAHGTLRPACLRPQRPLPVTAGSPISSFPEPRAQQGPLPGPYLAAPFLPLCFLCWK